MANNTTKEKDNLIRRRIVFGTLSNYTGQIISLITWFLLTPFILGRLGAADYGLWLLVSSVVAYGQLLDFGMTSAVIKYVPEFMARGELEQVQKLIATALRIYSALGLGAFGISIILAPFFPTFFNIAPEENNKAFWLVLLMGLSLGIEIPGMTAYSVLRGLQRLHIVNFLNIIGTLLTAFASVVVLLLGGSLLPMIALNIPITILMQGVAVWCLRQVAPEVKYGWSGASWEFVGRIVRFSSSVFIQQMGGRLQTRTDEIVIGIILPISYITPYSLARRLSGIAQLLTNQFMKVLMPLASELQAENDLSRLRKLYISSTRLTLAIFLPIGCTIVVLAPSVLTVWVGAAYASSANLVLILTLAGLVVASQWPAGAILQGIARHKILAITSLGSGLVNLVLSIALARPFGLLGVAYGTLIPSVIECLFIVLPFTLRIVEVKAVEALKDIFLPPFLPVIPTVAILYLLDAVVAPSSIFALIFIATVAGLIYLTIYLGVSISKEERYTYLNFASSTLQSMVVYLKRS